MYDYLDNQLDKYPLLEIVKKVEIEISNFDPDIIYTHFDGDLNIDHQIVSRSVLTATRLNKKIKKIFQFEILSSTEINFLNTNKVFQPNIFEDVSNYLNYKLLAMSRYKSEIRKWPNPRSKEGIKTNAKYRGMQSGQKLSEAFILVREIND